MTQEEIIEAIKSKCKFMYYSYDHKKAIEAYKERSVEKSNLYLPDCYSMPNELKEEFRVERIGKIRQVHFSPSGDIWMLKIGNKYSKTFYLSDFGKTIFILTSTTKTN